MTLPVSSLYPAEYDSDNNLFLVKDALRIRLLDDYNPGDTSILVEGETGMMDRFPPSGIITLTEQCSEIDKRAVTLHYASKTTDSFEGLVLLPEFSDLDSFKPRRITNVTMNVVAMHHNYLKNSLISVQSFLGDKYATDKETITGRIKYLESLAFKPKAWFSADTRLGLAALSVSFKNESFRLGPGRVVQTWNFGEGSDIQIATLTADEYKNYNNTVSGVVFKGDTVVKTYSSPGAYTVKLTIENDWGSSEVEFQNFITVKTECPEKAAISMVYRATQSYTPADPIAGTPPKIRSAANTFVDFEVKEGEDPERPGYSYGGELLSSGSPVDKILKYKWSLGDDLPHFNSPTTRASYSLGGIYDVALRVDTRFGSYRITKYDAAVDIVESRNLWMFNFSSPPNLDSSGIVKAYEFGLNSETFKTLGNQTLSIDRSNGFLSSYNSGNFHSGTFARAKEEFARNVEFVQSGSLTSGSKGNSMLFWAEGGAVTDGQEISALKYNAFDDHYESSASITGRPWNWVALSSPEKTYFLFGQPSSTTPNQNPTFAYRTDYDLSTRSAGAATSLGISSFENGADELLQHPSYFDPSTGVATNGYFATYRSAWKDSTGYILRNSAVNEFFRLSSFYKTNGSLASPFNTITSLPQITGSIKVEGELVSMSNGIFLFNNSGEICAWNDTSLTWEVGRAGSSSLTFRSVQDTNASSFDDRSNRLLASSDGDRVAYLSYDYSDKAFIKFNGVDLTFTTTKYRPPGKQLTMGVY